MRLEFKEPGGRGAGMLVVGLTGGIGSGKSTVAERFRVLGVPVVDADEISRELVEPGRPALARIVAAFGADILDSNGRLNRARLRGRVFADPLKRKELENILHPLIRVEMRRRMQSLTVSYCVVVIPLLLETGQRELVHRILVVDAPRDMQIRRAMARDGSTAQDVEAVMRAQVDNQTRLAAADDVIVNDQDLEALYRQVDTLHRRYQQIAAAQAFQAREAAPDGAWEPREQDAGDPAVAVFELPLNERMRTFARLERLFSQATHHLQGDTLWDSRAAVGTLLDLLDVFGRGDLKKEFLQEMERLTGALNKYTPMEGVDRSRLDGIQQTLSALSQRIYNINGQLGQNLRQHELLSAVKQKGAALAGACSFDLPSYYHWLNLPPEQRRADLTAWFKELEPVRRATDFIFELVRESGVPRGEEAASGFFQQSLDTSLPFQLIRVTLPRGQNYFAEISGGKHRFSVRFLRFKSAERPVQVEQSVKFELTCCAI